METKKIITPETRKVLRASFPDEAYTQHPTKTFLTTLKAMYVTERLNDVFGVGRWFIKPEIIERTNDYILIKGTFFSLDYDIAPIEQYGGHQTTGKNVEIADGYKSAITDCISKIASYFEIGIDMFKGKINVSDTKQAHPYKKDDNQSNFVIREITPSELEKNWNGKVYAGNCIYLEKEKIQLSTEQHRKILNHSKYNPDEKK